MNVHTSLWMNVNVLIVTYEKLNMFSPVWPIVLVATIHRHWSLASLQVKHYWMIWTSYNLFRSNKIVYITALNSLCLFSETFQLRVWQAACVPTDLSHFHPILICPRCRLVQRRRQSITEKSNQLISDWYDQIWLDWTDSRKRLSRPQVGFDWRDEIWQRALHLSSLQYQIAVQCKMTLFLETIQLQHPKDHLQIIFSFPKSKALECLNFIPNTALSRLASAWEDLVTLWWHSTIGGSAPNGA